MSEWRDALVQWFSNFLLTEQSRSRERAACTAISRHCGCTNDHRDSLKFVQEVARFVTSRFYWKKVARGVWKVAKSSDKVAKLATLRASRLTSLCLTAAHAFSNVYTHVQEYLDHGQSEGGPPFTDWFRPRYGPNVCLLLNHRETFRVAETFKKRIWTAGRTGATSDLF